MYGHIKYNINEYMKVINQMRFEIDLVEQQRPSYDVDCRRTSPVMTILVNNLDEHLFWIHEYNELNCEH